MASGEVTQASLNARLRTPHGRVVACELVVAPVLEQDEVVAVIVQCALAAEGRDRDASQLCGAGTV
jgi:hypothetical protein